MQPPDVARFQRVMAIFDSLCDVAEPERSRRLAELCGDDASLRAAVQTMLDHDAGGGASLDAPSSPLALLAELEELDTDGGPAERRDLAAGERVDRYEIVELLGEGGVGVVYRARDPELQRDVALKLLRVPGDGSGGASQRGLLEEAQALARLSHPNVVSVYDVGSHEQDVFLAMELVRGSTLQEWLAARSRSAREVLDVFCAAGRGLAAAHAAGLVHRDFKPSNVLVRDDGRVIVVDFGLARLTDAGGPPGADASERGAVRVTRAAGTPAYMAPEQFHCEDIGPHTDQFSFCVALYEALCGRLPFDPDRLASSEAWRAAEPPRRLPLRWRAAILRGLAVDPARRHASMGALLAELAPRGARLRTIVGAASITLIVVGALAGGWLVWDSYRHDRARRARETEAARRLVAVEQRVDALLADKRPADADAVFSAFAEHAEHQGTVALARAWLGRGERMRALRRSRDEVLAYAAAYAASPDAEQRVAALSGLAGVFLRRWAWAPLSVVLGTLEAQGHAERAAPLAAELALARRDLSGAAALLPQPGIEPVLRALSTGTPTDARALVISFVDIDGDGLDEIVLAQRRSPTLTVARAAPGLPVLFTVSLPPGTGTFDQWALWPLRRAPGRPQPLLIYSSYPGVAQVAYLAPGELRTVLTWDENTVLSAACASRRGGEPRCYVGTGHYTRKLYELQEGPAGWRRTEPAPGVNAAASDITALIAVDVDVDGDDELVAAVGPWQAFDVRVLRPAAAFATMGRRRLGTVGGIGALHPAGGGPPLLAVAKVDWAKSRIVFPESAPLGEPAGIYLLSPASRDLPIVRRLELAAPEGAAPPALERPYVVADLDGDGLDDIAVSGFAGGVSVNGERILFVYRQLENGSFAPAVVRGLRLLAARNLDGDAATELIVELPDSGRLWVLGAGTTPLPPLAFDNTPARAVPPAALSHPELAQSWERAEALVSMGLPESAATVLDDLVVLLGDTALGALARHRAAELWESAGDAARAAERYLQAADALGEGNAAALDGATRTLIRARRLGEALRTNERLAARADAGPELAARARERAGWLPSAARPQRRVQLAFDRPLEASWSIAGPVGVRRDPSANALWVDTAGGAGVLAKFPLECDAGPIVVTARIDLERTEWGSGLRVMLRARDGGAHEWLGLSVHTVGGGGFLGRELGCKAPEGAGTLGPTLDLGRITDTAALVMHADVIPALGEVVCRIQGVEPAVDQLYPWPRRLRAGAYDLVVENGGDRAVESTTSTVARIRGIEVLGCSPQATVPDETPLARGHRLMANGQIAEALAAYESDTGVDVRRDVGQAVALADLLRLEQGVAKLRAVAARARRGDGAAARALAELAPGLIRGYAPLARAGLGDTYFEAYARAWDSTVGMHPDDDLVQRSLTTDLAGLSARAAPAPLVVHLLLSRGTAHWRRGLAEAARADLEQSLEVGERAMRAVAVPGDLRIEMAEAARLLAAIDARAGQDGRALAHARRSLELDPSREMAIDRLLRFPELASLRDRPDWRPLFETAP